MRYTGTQRGVFLGCIFILAFLFCFQPAEASQSKKLKLEARLAGTFRDVKIKGNYAYLAYLSGNTSGLYVVDISNKSKPKVIGKCLFPASSLKLFDQGVHVVGNYAYIANG
jgi:hypothetical protein